MKKILLTRSSVCMADDILDNSLKIEVDENWQLPEILNKVLSMGYLPKVSGGKATWSVSCNNTVAIIAQQWIEPKFFGDTECGSCNTLRFKYHTQEDPELVYKIISESRSHRKH